jgi:hypothetical protein
MPEGRVPLLFHLDASSPPLSTIVKSEWGGTNVKIHHDGKVPARFDLRVNRYENETQLIVFFPDNPVARESVTRYIETLKSVFVRIAESRGTATPIRAGAQFQRQLV